jgi:hypothetical protein
MKKMMMIKKTTRVRLHRAGLLDEEPESLKGFK